VKQFAILIIVVMNLGIAQIARTSNLSPSFTIDTNLNEVSVLALSGNEIQIAGNIEKPLYLKFWATWCGGCLKQMPHLQKIYEAHIDELDVIAINIGLNDSVEQIVRVQKRFELTMPIVFDELGDISRSFDIEVTPYSVLIDRKGNIVYRGWGDEGIEVEIAKVIGGGR